MSDIDILKLSEKFILAIKMEEQYVEFTITLARIDYNTLYNQLNNDDKKKAFWINIYNAYTQIKLSNEKFRSIYPKFAFFEEEDIVIANHNFSLDDIEHKILRKSQVKLCMGYCTRWCVPRWESDLRLTQQDYRIHFGLNCGANSCPPVAFYDHSKIDKQLELAMKNFLRSDSVYDSSKNTLVTSKIFFWFKGDFGGNTGLINLHKENDIIPKDVNNVSIEYKEYDWKIEKKYV